MNFYAKVFCNFYDLDVQNDVLLFGIDVPLTIFRTYLDFKQNLTSGVSSRPSSLRFDTLYRLLFPY